MTFAPADVTLDDPVFLHTLSENAVGLSYHGMRAGVPTSGTLTANRIHYVPFYLTRPYSLARWFWLNGATVGTDYVQVGVYDKDLNLLRASPRTLSAGTVSQVQYATPGIHGTNITSGGDITDGTVYTTASVTLKAGVLYLISFSNSAASAAAASSIDSATGGVPTFASRSTTQFNGTAYRNSIWSCVPTADFTGTLRINFGATQTGCVWALNAFYHVDTATTDGIVQNAVGTGTSVTPLATLAAFGSANNATFGAFSAQNNAAGAPTAGYVELSDNNIATPVNEHHTAFRPDNDTTVDYTITSAPWGACAVEIKSLGTGPVYLPPMRGYLALHVSGATATVLRKVTWTEVGGIYLQASTTGLPAIGTPATFSGAPIVPLFGITRRASP